MIAAVEQAIIARIKAASDAGVLGYRFRQVESYGGQLDQVSTVVKATPAAWVILRGLRPGTDVAGDAFRVAATFAVMVAAKNARNERAARHGAAGDVGAYQLAMDVRALLIGHQLGLEIERLAPGAVNILAVPGRGSLAVLACEFTTAWIEEAAPADGGNIADFTTFHADWDIPPLGNATPPLPADDPDATDTVTLQEPEA